MIPTIGRWAQAPDLIEPIAGYRAWRYTSGVGEVQLFPLNLTADDLLPRQEWEGAWAAWVTASCLSPLGSIHPAPDESCTCGFYAMKSADEVVEFREAVVLQVASLRAERVDGVVFGRVLLAGKVIEHATGYRAERARIAGLIPTTTDGGRTLSLASSLELPVEPSWDTASLFREMDKESERIERHTHPGPLDRWRLRRHIRRFSLLHGDAPGRLAAQPPRPFNPRPFNPLGDASPPAA